MGRGGALTLWPPWSLAGCMLPGTAGHDIRRYGGRQRGGAGKGFTDSQSGGRMRPRGADGGGFTSSATRGLSFGACAPERVRAISTARLCASPRLHLRPIYVVVSDGPIGDLILGGASCLDAFSTYPDRRLLPGGAAGATTGSQEVRPTRSSRTSVGSPQISNAHNR